MPRESRKHEMRSVSVIQQLSDRVSIFDADKGTQKCVCARFPYLARHDIYTCTIDSIDNEAAARAEGKFRVRIGL